MNQIDIFTSLHALETVLEYEPADMRTDFPGELLHLADCVRDYVRSHDEAFGVAFHELSLRQDERIARLQTVADLAGDAPDPGSLRELIRQVRPFVEDVLRLQRQKEDQAYGQYSDRTPPQGASTGLGAIPGDAEEAGRLPQSRAGSAKRPGLAARPPR